MIQNKLRVDCLKNKLFRLIFLFSSFSSCNSFTFSFTSIFLSFIPFILFLFTTRQTFIVLMEKLKAVIDEGFFLTDFIPLNLFMLDCRRLNKVIISLMYEIKEFVTDYFKALNQKENRRYAFI